MQNYGQIFLKLFANQIGAVMAGSQIFYAGCPVCPVGIQ